jgi:formamidopyrimidine-DNA glycosylase
MPELPEVENTVSRLRGAVCGRRVTGVRVEWPRAVSYPDAARFGREVMGKRIVRIARRGKFIIFALEPARKDDVRRAELFLIAHMRMSGSFFVSPAKGALPKHVRVAFELGRGRRLCFRDPRKFGRFWLVRDADEIVGSLGPEPLDSAFGRADFERLIRAKSGRIKPLLLNQKFIAGVGNIYADESLWRAGIHPARSAASLSAREIAALYRSIRAVLLRAIRDQGTDIGDEVVCGDYTPLVYGRRAEPCRRCRRSIVRMVVGQRGTYICPGCQRL